jgi:hypothetical protein
MAEVLKLVFCVRRRPDLTFEEFQRYWLTEHGPLVRSLWEAGDLPTMVRYVQSHTIAGEPTDRLVRSRDAGEPYDGITEVWLSGDTPPERAEAARAAGARLLEDEGRFIDFARSTLFLTREHTIFGSP